MLKSIVKTAGIGLGVSAAAAFYGSSRSNEEVYSQRYGQSDTANNKNFQMSNMYQEKDSISPVAIGLSGMVGAGLAYGAAYGSSKLSSTGKFRGISGLGSDLMDAKIRGKGKGMYAALAGAALGVIGGTLVENMDQNRRGSNLLHRFNGDQEDDNRAINLTGGSKEQIIKGAGAAVVGAGAYIGASGLSDMLPKGGRRVAGKVGAGLVGAGVGYLLMHAMRNGGSENSRIRGMGN